MRKEYFYNEKNWLVRRNEYAESGECLAWTEYRYNDVGDRIGWDYYTKEGKQFSDTELINDEHGRQIKIVYNEERQEVKRGLYEYAEDGSVCGYSDGINTYIFFDVPEQVYALYAHCNFDDLILTIQ